MKIISKNGKQIIRISKSEWEKIGKKAGFDDTKNINDKKNEKNYKELNIKNKPGKHNKNEFNNDDENDGKNDGKNGLGLDKDNDKKYPPKSPPGNNSAAVSIPIKKKKNQK